MDNLTALADEIERAEGPSRELEAAIKEAQTGKCPHVHVMTVDGDGDGWMEVCSRCCEEEPDTHIPRYTASIDAALTLVPEGWNGVIHIRDGSVGLYQLSNPKSHINVNAATDALALCAAALRAKAGAA